MEGKSENKFICLRQDCGKAYANTDALRKHQRQKQHECNGGPSVAKLLCPFIDCDKRFPRMANLCAHVKNEHNAADAIIEETSFENFEKFHEWKLQLEETTYSSYVQHEAAKLRNRIKHHYFYCHRSGQSCKVIQKEADRRQVVKSQGICKIEATCTAHMAASVDVTSNAVTVSFCRYHAGHSLDLGHLRLSKVARLEAAALLQQGVTISKVMDTMRDRVGLALKRDNLICRKDIQVMGLREEEITPAADVEPMQLDVPLSVPSVSSEIITADSMDAIERLRQRLLSEFQQGIALASSCDSMEAMACAMTHMKTANASLRAVAKSQTKSLQVARKLSANKKLDKQLRFFGTKAKRKPASQGLTKPCTAKVSSLRKMLLHGTTGRTTQHNSTIDSSHTSVVDALFNGCSDVPYCVDTEVVIA